MSAYDLFPYQEGHRMDYSDKDDEWRCPECGRIVKFSNGKMITIEIGNIYATHSGSRDISEVYNMDVGR